ncbi:MAG TPA: RluA family pseudouridine synthase [Burkholderiaceae bacterium]|nr:RluA family pseudouridine synthase [Burkholderiaceae bacterium]
MSSAPTDFDADQRPDEVEPGDETSEIRAHAVTLEQHGERLDKLLTSIAPEFSRAHLQGLVADGRVQVDGKVSSTSSAKVKAGMRVQVELVRPAHELAFKPETIPLNIVYEDEHVLVVDKPAGLVVHPAAGNWSGTLLNGLLARDPAAVALPRAGIVHRLDKDTSGLMVVGRTLPAVTGLMRDIAARVVSRKYLALVHGRLKLDQDSIEAPIGRDPKVRVRMAVIHTGKWAKTDIDLVAYDQGIGAVRCTLHTGRTHQIRVHLAFRGHPLVSDELYGGRPALGMARQALHAAHLAFKHPITGEPLRFDSAPPADFQQAWAQIVGDDLLEDFDDADDGALE